MTIDLHLAAALGLIVFCVVALFWYLLRKRKIRRPPSEP
jgi:hypothetical protein